MYAVRTGARRAVLALAAACTVVALMGVGAPVAARFTSPGLPAEAFDFDGDGYADLAAKAAGEDVGATPDAGAVSVIYGSSVGLTATGNQFWSQDSSGVPGGSEAGDGFGPNASGDFNSDGYADLAVGVPGEDIGPVRDAGAVNVLYGSPVGLRSTGSRFFSQATAGMPGGVEPGDIFGAALTVGDFNGDLHSDLAIGAAREDIGTNLNASGAVTVLYGSATGLQTQGAQLWSPSALDVGVGYFFGEVLGAGDVTRDGRDELVVGDGHDSVYVLRGGVDGLVATAAQRLRDTDTDLPDVFERPRSIGDALAVGDFDGDRHADLALGAQNADEVFEGGDACHLEDLCEGAMTVLHGAPGGLENREGWQVWQARTSGLPDLGGRTYSFGNNLAAGDLNGDGAADLAIGVEDDVEGGLVLVMYARPGAGLSAFASQAWWQGRNVSGANEPNDYFGQRFFGQGLRVAQFSGSHHADLAVGVPGENLGQVRDAGRAVILFGGSAGLTSIRQQSWSQNSASIRGAAEEGDNFSVG